MLCGGYMQRGCMGNSTGRWDGKGAVRVHGYGLTLAQSAAAPPNAKVRTENGSMFLTTNNSHVTFLYYDTPHKRYKEMTKAYMSAMVQVSPGRLLYLEHLPLLPEAGLRSRGRLLRIPMEV